MTQTHTRQAPSVLVVDAAVSLRAARLMIWIQMLTAVLLTSSIFWGIHRHDRAVVEPTYWRHDWLYSWTDISLIVTTVVLDLMAIWLSRRFRSIRVDRPGVAVAAAAGCCLLVCLPAFGASITAPWFTQRTVMAVPHGLAAVVMVVFINPWIERYTARMAEAVKST